MPPHFTRNPDYEENGTALGPKAAFCNSALGDVSTNCASDQGRVAEAEGK